MDDLISRQAAVDALAELARERFTIQDCFQIYLDALTDADKKIQQLPPIQPEIIRCRECKFASGDSRICMKFDHSPIGELDFCSFAERREVNHESN